jgi:hypothetical protein
MPNREKNRADIVLPMRKLGLLFSVVIVAGAQDLSTRFDEIAKARAEAKQFMGNVLVAKGDQVLFEKSYGFANMQWNVSNTAVSKFRGKQIPDRLRD